MTSNEVRREQLGCGDNSKKLDASNVSFRTAAQPQQDRVALRADLFTGDMYDTT